MTPTLHSKKLTQSGFTLMEVLIAITILSFIMVSIVTIQDNSQVTKDRVLSEDRNWLQVETAFARFEWDFSQIFSPLYYSHAMRIDELLSEDEQEAFATLTNPYASNENFAFPSYDSHPVPIYKLEDKNSFEFFTTSNRRKFKNIKQSNFAWVRYTLETFKDPNSDFQTKALVRYFYPDDPFTPFSIQWDDIKGQILLKNIEKLQFKIWDSQNRKWKDRLDLVQDGRHKIEGIKIIMEWIDKDGVKFNFERIFRPLFQKFTPEDMYKLIRKTNNNKKQVEEIN